jgi:hypothetical protein
MHDPLDVHACTLFSVPLEACAADPTRGRLVPLRFPRQDVCARLAAPQRMQHVATHDLLLKHLDKTFKHKSEDT